MRSCPLCPLQRNLKSILQNGLISQRKGLQISGRLSITSLVQQAGWMLNSAIQMD